MTNNQLLIIHKNTEENAGNLFLQHTNTQKIINSTTLDIYLIFSINQKKKIHVKAMRSFKGISY